VSFLDELGGLTGGAASEALAFAAGFAAARALEPAAVTISQDAWNAAQVRRLDAGTAAGAAAEGVIDPGTGASEASYSGYDETRFQAMYGLALTAPGQGELLQMLRRGTIDGGEFDHGLRKAKLETQWNTPIAQLAQQPLGVEALATMVQRGVIPNPGWIPFPIDFSGSDVPPMPQVEIDPVEQAKWWGIDTEQMAALTRIVGLPASPDLAARMLYRGIINEPAFRLAIAEGNTRDEWAPFLLDGFRQILTAAEYAELQLRGFLTVEERRTNTAKTGMSETDSDLLYNVLGRAPAVHTITKGLAFGGTYNGGSDGIPEVYLSALQRGNLRPEYYDIAYHDRYLWPSAFVLRSLTQTGEITADDAEQVLTYIGWEPDFAKKVAHSWGGSTPAVADPHVTKALGQLWTVTHKSYVNQLSTDAETSADLSTIGVGADAIPQVLKLWQAERAVTRRSLTPAQIKKAVADQLETEQWATQRLLALGYSATDASTLLSE
jgi:hypothetical protein